mgnify:FL=1
MNESTPNLEELAHLLCASGDYRVQRRLSPRSTVTPPDGTPTKSALVIDVETTGLDLEKDDDVLP